jgi:hypothetical protein
VTLLRLPTKEAIVLSDTTTFSDVNQQLLTHLDLGEDDPRVSIEVGDDTVYVYFAEHLQFHQSRGLPNGIVDTDGDLTDAGRARIQTRIRALLADRTTLDPSLVSVDEGEESSKFGDEQGFVAVLAMKVSPRTAVRDFYVDTAWPFVATMVNVTDPGTFNCPYLFTDI